MLTTWSKPFILNLYCITCDTHITILKSFYIALAIPTPINRAKINIHKRSICIHSNTHKPPANNLYSTQCTSWGLPRESYWLPRLEIWMIGLKCILNWVVLPSRKYRIYVILLILLDNIRIWYLQRNMQYGRSSKLGINSRINSITDTLWCNTRNPNETNIIRSNQDRMQLTDFKIHNISRFNCFIVIFLSWYSVHLYEYY